jgi:hypothetical protein
MHRLSLRICLVVDHANGVVYHAVRLASPKRVPEAAACRRRLTFDGIDPIEAQPAEVALEAGSNAQLREAAS